MAVDPQARSSRRSVIAAGLAAAGGLAAAQLGKPGPAAAVAPAVSLGVSDATNQATDLTQVENTTAGGTSLAGHHASDGVGLSGDSATGSGLVAASTNATPSDFTTSPSHRNGVVATVGDTSLILDNSDEIGVYGFSAVSDQSVGVFGHSDSGAGVFGLGGTGVIGTGGWGILGDVGLAGVGVYGNIGNAAAPAALPAGVVARSESTSGIALRVTGRTVFSYSGRATVATGHSSVKVSKAGVSSASLIIATPKTNRAGVFVQAVVPTTNAFTIYLSKKVTGTTYVSYLILG
jgi:hypothetical protein